MRKKGNRTYRVVFICVIAFTLAFISGCGSSGDSATDLETAKTQILGSWYHNYSDGTLCKDAEFYQDGTVNFITDHWGTWSLLENEAPGKFTLRIVEDAKYNADTFVYEIEINGDQLTSVDKDPNENTWFSGTFTNDPG